MDPYELDIKVQETSNRVKEWASEHQTQLKLIGVGVGVAGLLYLRRTRRLKKMALEATPEDVDKVVRLWISLTDAARMREKGDGLLFDTSMGSLIVFNRDALLQDARQRAAAA